VQSLLDGLPPEIAKQVDPDCRRNEIGYWASHDELLGQYANQWIGFADGRVIACGRSPVEVLHAAKRLARHPFVTCVGREHEPCRMRRSAFPYDRTYPGEPLPVVTMEFRQHPDSLGLAMETVIPDTGADASAPPLARL